MEQGLIAPLSSHEEVTLRRLALSISSAKQLPARDVAYLIRLRLVEEKEAQLTLTNIGRQRYQALPKAEGMTGVTDKDEAAAILGRHLLRARDR
jgi:hypothetical protein